jgi:ADP-heptose:LPS heptosyltransferase
LACAVTSRQPSGIWPADRFLETIRYVRARRSCAILYTGAKSDRSQLEGLAQATGADAFVLAGELDLLPFVALLGRCQAALAPDSGTRHLANAAGIPVVFLRNISFRQAEAGSYCETDHDMVPVDLEMIDAKKQAAAFAAIDPAQVGDEVIRLLDAGRTSARTQ